MARAHAPTALILQSPLMVSDIVEPADPTVVSVLIPPHASLVKIPTSALLTANASVLPEPSHHPLTNVNLVLLVVISALLPMSAFLAFLLFSFKEMSVRLPATKVSLLWAMFVKDVPVDVKDVLRT